MSGKGTPHVVVGFKYYIGIHMVTCYGPVDSVRGITVGDRVAWVGDVTSTQDVSVNAPDLFGGDKREGGVSATVGFKFGDKAQTKDPYLVAQMGPITPAYRGVMSFIIKQGYIGVNPYLKPWSFTVKRLPMRGWYDSKIDIGGQANPAHIIYEVITNTDWGMGMPASSIDDTSFKAAADTLYSENFGLGLIWSQQSSVQDFIQLVLNHIGAVLRVNNATGLFELKLIRSDYTPSSLPLLNESNILSLDSYQRAAWGDTVNEIVLQYTDPDEIVDNIANPSMTVAQTAKRNARTSITVQDVGNLQMQGSVVSETVSYPGIRNDLLAQRVAMRDLRARSTPVSKLKITVNRSAWNLHAGDVFRFSWTKLGLTEVVYRVGNINTGSMESGKITIDAVEDIFGMPTNVYAAQQPTGWVTPRNPPSVANYRILYEAPYWDVMQAVGETQIGNINADTSYVACAAAAPTSDSYNYDFMTGAASNALSRAGSGSFSPNCIVPTALVQETSSSILYQQGSNMSMVAVGDYGIIDGEIVSVTAINTNLGSLTLNRGVLDTVPVTHNPNARIFFPSKYRGIDNGDKTVGETVYAAVLPSTGMGTLALANAPVDSISIVGRQGKPYPPGNVQVNAQAYPSVMSGILSLTWAHRDRTQQTVYLVDQTAGNIGPEANVSYNLRLYDENNTLCKSVSLATTNYVWSTEVADCGYGRPNGKIRVELEATRGGRVSFTKHSIQFDRKGYGLQYGKYYGG